MHSIKVDNWHSTLKIKWHYCAHYSELDLMQRMCFVLTLKEDPDCNSLIIQIS